MAVEIKYVVIREGEEKILRSGKLPEAEGTAEAPADRAEAEEGDKTDDVVESEAPAPAKPRKAKAA